MENQHTEKQQTEVVIIGAGYAGLLATVRLAGRLRVISISYSAFSH